VLDLDENDEVVDQREYRSMISSLMYLTRHGRTFNLSCVCVHAFNLPPHSSHRTTVQRIFRYLKHTPEFGVWYFASSSLDLVCFSDANLRVVGLTKRALLVHAILLDPLLFPGLLKNNLQLLNPPQRQSM
jgi:hypothetical protein